MTITIITPQHRQRGGLNKPGRFVSPTGVIICSSCGKKQGETRFYKRGDGKGFQQPCGPCKYARLKAKRENGQRECAISEPHNPRHAAPGDKQVACPFPGCVWTGNCVELNKHRKEHEQ